MKKMCALCLGLFVLLAIPAAAVTLNFDDLTCGGFAAIPDGYGGLNWDGMYCVNTATVIGGAGYLNGMVSSPNVAFNYAGNPAEISGSPFTLNSAYFTAAWNDGLTVTVDGYVGGLSGTLIDTTSFTLDPDGPTLETFNWTGIDTVEFVSSGGTLDPTYLYDGAGTQFVMDDLTINNSITPVPEPSSLILLGSGLVGIVGKLRRRLQR